MTVFGQECDVTLRLTLHLWLIKGARSTTTRSAWRDLWLGKKIAAIESVMAERGVKKSRCCDGEGRHRSGVSATFLCMLNTRDLIHEHRSRREKANRVHLEAEISFFKGRFLALLFLNTLKTFNKVLRRTVELFLRKDGPSQAEK